MTALIGGILAVIVEALLKFFTSKIIMKMVMATMTYTFLFAIIPMLISFLVPSSIMNAMDSYMNMLQSGPDSVACSGAVSPGGGNSISCSGVIQMAQWGKGVAYILDFFQFTSALQVFLPAMAVSFLFKRI